MYVHIIENSVANFELVQALVIEAGTDYSRVAALFLHEGAEFRNLVANATKHEEIVLSPLRLTQNQKKRIAFLLERPDNGRVSRIRKFFWEQSSLAYCSVDLPK